MSQIELNPFQYLEVEKLHLGAFLPLAGFLDEDAFHGVVDHMRLPDGSPFPLPVVLDLTARQKSEIQGRPRVSLTFEGQEVGELRPESLFRCDKSAVARKLFGTDDIAHPGVANLMATGDWFVGGPITLFKRPELEVSRWELSPQETKAEFAKRGWRTVVGFQTRNVPHRAHEHLHLRALEQADGLFIQPLVGWRKVGDYMPDAIIAGYQTLIADFLPRDRVVLGILSTAMRYAGPREALFHAIIRRNYGCTHFIVGRDHAGVGNYYRKYEAHELVRRFDGELGIRIMYMYGPFHCRICDGIVTEQTCPHGGTAPEAITEISGSEIRTMLLSGKKPDQLLMRPEVLASLENTPLFIEDGGS